MDIRFKVVLVVTLLTVTVPNPLVFRLTVEDAPPLILYVTVELGVPVMVKTPSCPEQIALEIAAVGGCGTLNVPEAIAGVQPEAIEYVTVYVPAIEALKLAVFPGFDAPDGTVQA